jgi:hypothetical protein
MNLLIQNLKIFNIFRQKTGLKTAKEIFSLFQSSPLFFGFGTKANQLVLVTAPGGQRPRLDQTSFKHQ